MSTLRICLFGSVRITHSGWKDEVKVPRAVQTLFAYLLLNRHRTYPREVLTGLFWGERPEECARNCLRTALWRLRKVLEPVGTPRGTYLVSSPLGEVGFNGKSRFWLDVSVFEETACGCLAKPVLDMGHGDSCGMGNVLELCTGDFLEGFYDDWAIRERERLRSLYLKSLAHLMQFHKYHGDYDKSLSCGHRILNHDPLREEVHREMMWLYAAGGRRADAIRQFKTCCLILKKELDVPPMEETHALYHRIHGETGDLREKFVPREDRVVTTGTRTQDLEQAIERLSTAMHHFEKSQEQIHQSKRLLEKTLKGARPPDRSA